LTTSPTNPFSKMKLLQQSFERDKANQGTSFAAAGQAFSGAYDSNKQYLSDNNLQNVDRLQRDYKSAKHGLDYSNTQSDDQYNSTTANAALQRLIQQLGIGQTNNG
jgi:hypothetical protein